ncbi:DUF1697 domain-containing protein [Janibacter terrae]|uniref:DUF1697 domain-containing protein n=1 Tax=Janibacter terrae TaxID=103817 RepID=UPI00082F187C|nr:DUF1697 domain-containing protein [Janibacter terrae]
MATYIAFLRAINLGATRRFPKADVQRVVEETGATDVAVHLNTGNVRLTSRQRSTAAVAATLEAAFLADRGFEVMTIVLTSEELVQVVADAEEVAQQAPFAVAAHYVTLMREAPDRAGAALLAHEDEGEVAAVRGRAVHLVLDGKDRYHQVKLPAAADRAMGVWTNRNLTVVRDLASRWG